jgi:Cu+-exporting ATPase
MGELSQQGNSVVLVAIDDVCRGAIGIADSLRPHAGETIVQLRRLGIESAMVTGDHQRTAQAVAKEIGIAEVYAGLTPQQKLEILRDRQKKQRVGFVGDGLNDAPALAAADVGFTFASATDVAAGAADITIVHDDLTRLPAAVQLARRSVRIIKQNLFWAFAYNFAALPLAATGHVPPGIAAAAMMFSSISVVLNSLRLRR